MAGTDLFTRDATLTVGTTKISCRDSLTGESKPTLRFVFKVMKSLTKDPNTCEIGIYNLSKEHRAALQQRNIATLLEAGYVGSAHQIFLGNLQFSQSVQSGTNWVTTLQAGDGAEKIKSSRINLGIRAPVTAASALKQVAAALGVKSGNTDKAAANGSLRKELTEFAKGLVLSGKADLQLDKIAKAMGLQWSIQDDQLVFLGPTETIGSQIITLQPGTGLVGSPEQGERGYIKARTLLQPDLLPGCRVDIQSREVKGQFRIERSTFTGDTWGVDWYTDIEAKPL